MKDIVFPKGNEEEFLDAAGRLGYDELLFVSDKHDFAMVDKKTVLKSKKGKVFKSNRVDDRWMIEKGKPDIIFGFEDFESKDFIHHRNSGLNQVLCKLMAKNKIKYGVSVRAIIEADGFYRGQLLGRISQNIQLCRKYKVKIVIGSFAEDPYQMKGVSDVVSLFVSLGMHTKEVKDALS